MGEQGTLELINVSKDYEHTQVLKNFNFSIQLGEFVSLLGPSGCGKTTIIRLIAGLETCREGEIYLEGRRIDNLPPYRRPVNTIFQNYALFPHLNVFDNIAYGLRAKRLPAGIIREKVFEALDLVQLKGFEKRQPHEMSGGQKQRVSIARAIVNKPPVLLLDEPLTALDLKLRKEMRYELRALQQKLGITFLYVTHDQEEALAMSDRVAVMNAGLIEQAGSPYDLFTRPDSPFSAQFIGDNNIFEGQVRETQGDDVFINLESGLARARGTGFQAENIVNLYIRPDKIRWSIGVEAAGFHLPGMVTEKVLTGAFVRVVVRLSNGKDVRINRLAGRDLPEEGQRVLLYWQPDDVVIMPSPNQPVYNAMGGFDITQVKQT